ncbi:MAG: hypothetical protein ACR2KT_05415, partial [Methylocella sp.]
NHADDDRVITADILRQNPEKIAERSSGEVSPLNRSRFHTVCKENAQLETAAIYGGCAILAPGLMHHAKNRKGGFTSQPGPY